MDIDKDILYKWVHVEKLSYIEICRRLNCSTATIKKYMIKHDIPIPIRTKRQSPAWNKNKTKYHCQYCGKPLPSTKGYRKFCDLTCFSKFYQKEKYENYLNNQDNFVNKEITYQWLKPIILHEQDNKCSICGMEPIWNNKELHFILDHIDGDAQNNRRNNLRLICPNCDSQLDTFKSRNMGKSTRKYKPYRISNIDKDLKE